MNDTRFESCIKCTVCTTTCPVSRVNPRYPGPKQAGPDGERLRLKDGALYDEALKYCINCKRCEVACPSDVKIGDIIQRARAQYGQQKPTLRDAILSHTDLMGTLSTPFAPLVNAATGLKPVRRLLDATLNIDHRRTLPKYGFGTFRRAYRQLAARQKQYSEQVAFFHVMKICSFLCRKQVSVNLSRDGWCLSFVETVRSSGILWSSGCSENSADH